MEHLQNYCLRWNNYQTNLVKVFDEMLKNENFTDVTIVTENGAKFKCHKMILAACSKFFQDIFINVPCEQHLVVLLKDVKSHDMSHILEYMYTGQVNVEQSRLTSIIRTAEELQIKGLTGDEKLTRPEDDDHRMDDARPSRPSSNHVQTVVHSSSMHSPPHSTNSMYKNPYSNMYSKMHPNDRANMNLNMWHVPGLALPPPSAQMENSSNHFSGPSPPIMSPYDQPPPEVYHHRRKKFSSVMMPKDTPILRTVLGQGQDMSQPVSLVVNQGDVKEENTDQERKHMRTEELPEDNQSSNDYHTEEDVKPRIIVPSSSPLSFTHDMRLVSSGIANYIPVRKTEGNKRYKQYSNHDLNAAIEDVRRGMSALMAAKKHKVPSRTLYDKVKKLGIKSGEANGKSGKRASTGSIPDYNMPDDQSDSPRRMSESEEFALNNNASVVTKAFIQHAVEDNLKALAFASALQKSNRAYALNPPLSPQVRYLPYNRLSSRSSAESDNHSESPHREKENDDDQVEDLSMNRRQEGVIVPPMNQVSAIMTEETQRDRNEDSRRNVNFEKTTP